MEWVFGWLSDPGLATGAFVFFSFRLMYVVYTLVVPMIIKANYVCSVAAYCVCSVQHLPLDLSSEFIPSFRMASERHRKTFANSDGIIYRAKTHQTPRVPGNPIRGADHGVFSISITELRRPINQFIVSCICY